MERLVLLVVAAVPSVHPAIPGAFFWRPRLSLDLGVPMPEIPRHAATPKNVYAGLVVAIDGYHAGTLALALAAGLEVTSDRSPINHLHPGHSYFYTNAYRWLVRHLKLYPPWLGDRDLAYTSAHRVWYNRYSEMDTFVPRWLRPLVPWVSSREWSREEREHRRFNKYANSAFRLYNTYPHRKFRKYKTYEVPGGWASSASNSATSEGR